MLEASESQARRCTGCGASIEMPAGDLSMPCAYCGSPLVDEDRAREHIDRVVPFRLTREQAGQRLSAHLRGSFWAPRSVRRLVVGGQGLRGVLVPHWAFQGVVRGEYEARIGIHWTRVVTRGKKTEVKRETEWFSMGGSAARSVEDHLVSASSGLPEPESNALEPFDLGWARPVDARLLAGFEAELPSVHLDDALETASAELAQSESRRITTQLLPGDRKELSRLQVKAHLQGQTLVLLPVWVASLRAGETPYRILVNGQSGECVGQPPVSRLRVAAAVTLALALLALAYTWLTYWNSAGGPG